MKQFLLFFAISILASCGGGESTGGSGSTDGTTDASTDGTTDASTDASTDGTTDAGQAETVIEGLTTPSKISVVTAN